MKEGWNKAIVLEINRKDKSVEIVFDIEGKKKKVKISKKEYEKLREEFGSDLVGEKCYVKVVYKTMRKGSFNIVYPKIISITKEEKEEENNDDLLTEYLYSNFGFIRKI